jgi:hypothetical protein
MSVARRVARGVGRGVMAVSELAPFYRNARQRSRSPRALAISARGIDRTRWNMSNVRYFRLSNKSLGSTNPVQSLSEADAAMPARAPAES